MLKHPVIHLKDWIEENRHLLKPPVGNKQVFLETDDFIIMIVGGPNSRTDYHYNETEEFFYQLEGNIHLKLQIDGEAVRVDINEGDIFLLPAKIPHSPQRGENTVGIVIEKIRKPGEKDGLQWYCRNCNHLLYEEYFILTDIVSQMQPVFEKFYQDDNLRTCNKCGTVMEVPEKYKK
jgi:3-hydroxyanthranilate 3,4-dioxygenase